MRWRMEFYHERARSAVNRDDPAGISIEESAIQFRSAAAAEVHGCPRLAAFEEARRERSVN